MTKKKKNNIFFLIFWALLPFTAHGAYLVRDAETEDYIRKMTGEILLQADINPKSINLFLVKDDSINAFVYGGPNIFVNTGLLQNSNNYEMVQAVLAHEIGHIKALHLIQFTSNINNALMEALFYSVSGALIALSGGVGAAVITGLSVGANVAEKRMLSYTRMQEMEADFYAFKFLSGVKSSGNGAIVLFDKLQKMQDKFVDSRALNPYYMTHPFPSQRLEFFKQKFDKLNYDPIFNNELQRSHLMILAKLAGYFGNLNASMSSEFLKNPEAKLYFEGFTEFRKQNFVSSEKIFRKMLAKDDKNPYLYEILAQIKHKNQEYDMAIELFKKALEIKPNEFSFLSEIADSYEAKKQYDMAIFYMEKALKLEPFNPQVSFKLAEFYSSKKEHSIAKLYFIESEILRGRYAKAKALFAVFKKEKKKLPLVFEAKASDIEDFLKQK